MFESTLEHFKVLTVPHLKAFIHIRMFDEVKIPKKAKFKFPKKGTVGEAQAGIRNLLSLAYDLRCKEVLFTVNDEVIERVEEENEREQEDETVMIEATSIFSFSLDDVPSCYLQNQSWGTPLEPDNLTVEVKERADLLLKILITRFKQHVSRRIDDEDKHSNFALLWFMSNLPRLCAMLILYKDVSYDIVAADNDTTLLSHPSDFQNSFVIVEGEVNELEG